MRATPDRRIRSWRSASAVLLSGLAVAATLAACSSTQTPTATASASTKSTVPPAAFSDRTGVTATSVSIGNVSTLLGGLFEGAVVGTRAYAAYVNSRGGIHGRKLVVDSADDNFQGAPNRQYTQAAVAKDFALVGSFSLQDNFGGAVLAANPSVPNVTVSLDTATANLPNSFSPSPAANGWQLGPLVYFQKLFPSQVLHAGALVADQPSAIAKWNGELAAMQHLGYKVVYDPQFDITTTDFNQYVVAMRNAGVKILFIEQMPQNYAAAVFRAMTLQNYHPIVVLGASTYSTQLVPNAGGPSAIDGAYLEQNTSLYLGEDAAAIPSVNTFLTWVQNVSPGFKADLFTLYGWVSAELFGQALQSAGSDPTRGSVLKALRSITSYSGDNIIATANPADKVPGNCYIIAKVSNGQFVRTDDPPTSGSTHGYRCDQPYYYPP
jgi:branched-chain amino acid transport system substrate-binding protein